MSTAAPGPSWSDIAGWYDGLLSAGSGPHETAVQCLLRLVPPLVGSRVLDVACGQGLATRALADAGVTEVVGVDSSGEMLELARRHDAAGRAHLSYLQDDAQTLTALEDESFDGVTCQLGLMDIRDLQAAIGAIRRVLKPGGWLAFVIGHPCFLVPDAIPLPGPDGRPAVSITGYFDERFWRSSDPAGVRRAGSYHRTLSTYLNALVRARFVLEAVEEPTASLLLARQQPLYTQVPIFFAVRARRGGTSAAPSARQSE